MKCIWHWKWIDDPYVKDSNYMKVEAKFVKAIEEHPDDFPKLSASIHTGRGVGFRLVEGNEQQLANLAAIWTPVEDWRFEVYFEGSVANSPMEKARRKYT